MCCTGAACGPGQGSRDPVWARFGRALEGQSLRIQSGRQDSNLRPSAPKAVSGLSVLLASLAITGDLASADLPGRDR